MLFIWNNSVNLKDENTSITPMIFCFTRIIISTENTFAMAFGTSVVACLNSAFNELHNEHDSADWLINLSQSKK